MRFMAYSPCYRREAGSAGRDTRGMLRSHEFDKVEILALATPEQAPALLDEMVGRVEATIAALELPYRIIEICTGDMGQTPSPQLRHRGLRAGCRSVARGLVGELVQRLPGAPRQHPVPPARRRRQAAEGHRSSCTRSTARRWPCRACGRRSSRTTATPTARSRSRHALRPYMRGIEHDQRETDDRTIDAVRDRAAVQYETAGLDVADVAADPMEQWQRWHDDAFDAGVAEPNAMTLSTVDDGGAPDARIVLVRGADDDGFTFFTNYESAKSRQLDRHPAAAATFGWLDLHRQVRLRGSVDRVSASRERRLLRLAPARRARSERGRRPSRSRSHPRRARRAGRRRSNGGSASGPVTAPAVLGRWRAACPSRWEFWQGRASRSTTACATVLSPMTPAGGSRRAGALDPVRCHRFAGDPGHRATGYRLRTMDGLMRTDRCKLRTLLPQANDPCWCGSGRKYKRCHKRSRGPGAAGCRCRRCAACPTDIDRPPYAETGIPVALGRTARSSRPRSSSGCATPARWRPRSCG